VRGKPFLIGFFIVVAAVAALSIYSNRSVDKADRTVTSVASPDSKYKAVRVSVARGGAQPFCFDTIAIFLSVYPDSFAESDKTYEVYAAPCAAPALRAELPKIEWLLQDAVRITFPPEAAAAKMRRQDLDASKFVHVTFVQAQ
jgi:hypothetical protein